jgi:hypothetical protein
MFAKAYGSAQTLAENRRDHAGRGQHVERFRHCLGRSLFGIGKQMDCDVDTQLHRAREVDAEDILKVRARSKRIGRGRAPLLDAFDAPAQCLELGGNDQRIHV